MGITMIPKMISGRPGKNGHTVPVFCSSCGKQIKTPKHISGYSVIYGNSYSIRRCPKCLRK
jgi:hypothetical protein